ncbi:MAG: PTS glucose transporter subunit IIA [Nocardiopsaceae bacterium]|nr:PTS glucose transporter subunit IIA [Nocardiopsaceae bacterium]
MLLVLAPVTGAAVDLSEVPDPVFAQSMVGPGVAIRPLGEAQEAVAPVHGTVVKLHAHAFVVVDPEGRGVLVHLGIDTVKLGGDGFAKLAAEGEHVAAGTPLVRWDPARVEAKGLSSIVPVVALDADGAAISPTTAAEVAQGDRLFDWA